MDETKENNIDSYGEVSKNVLQKLDIFNAQISKLKNERVCRELNELAAGNKKAFAQVYSILSHTDKKIYNKITQHVIEYIFSNIDKEYNLDIDYKKSINDQELFYETRLIISYIYKEYLLNDNEKIKIEELKKEKIKNTEDVKIGIEDIKKIFEEKNISKQEKESLPIEYNKIKWYKKLFINLFNK